MKIFDLSESVKKLNSPNIISLLNSIELYKGKTLAVTKLKKLDKLTEIARESGVVASNAVGNVFVEDSRVNGLLSKTKAPQTFEEHMMVGYSNALDLINQVYKFQPFDRSFISTLHYYIYKDYNPEFGGHFKDTQNYIHEVLPDGSFNTLFVPVAPEEVVPLLDNLIYQFNECARDEKCNKLLLTAVFLLDFVCIHPYNHGNGRTSRLILDFLLKRFGYEIDNYFSIPYLYKQHLDNYIDSLVSSTDGWYDNENDYEPFVTFVLKIVLEAYRKLDYIMEVNDIEGNSDEKVLKIIVDSATPISKTVIQNVLYNTSSATIEKALSGLLKERKIQLITKGRYSKYFRGDGF